MTLRILKPAVAALAMLPVAVPAIAADEPSLDVTAEAGYRYDSNVSLTELDTNLGKADNAVLLELGLDGSVPVTDAITVRAGYGLNHTAYEEFSEFDTAIHRLQGDLNWRVRGFDAGLSLRHFAARLDGESFLDIRQLSPSVARLIGKKLYLRGAFTASDKTYAGREERDATNDAFDVDAYWLIDGMQRYLAFGYRIDSEDAVMPELDYGGRRVKLTYRHELEAVPLTVEARAGLEHRDYDNVDETIGSERRDRRFRAGLSATLPVAEYFGIELEARYADFRSNLPAADFDEMLYGVSLRASF